jgi:hypothetical protein
VARDAAGGFDVVVARCAKQALDVAALQACGETDSSHFGGFLGKETPSRSRMGLQRLICTSSVLRLGASCRIGNLRHEAPSILPHQPRRFVAGRRFLTVTMTTAAYDVLDMVLS